MAKFLILDILLLSLFSSKFLVSAGTTECYACDDKVGSCALEVRQCMSGKELCEREKIWEEKVFNITLGECTETMEPVCVTVITKTEKNHTMVDHLAKHCGYKGQCEFLKSYVECYECTENLCNIATKSFPDIFKVVMTILNCFLFNLIAFTLK